MIRHVLPQVRGLIRELASQFKDVPGLLLNEDDLKCQLVARLATIDTLRNPVESADPGYFASAVHSEVPWFDEDGHLTMRPDITITDPRKLSILHAMDDGFELGSPSPLPRKAVHFVGDSILLELKFYRGKNGVPTRSADSIRSDMKKMSDLIARGRSVDGIFLHGIMVVFSRYDRWSDAVRSIPTTEHVDFFAESGAMR